VDSDFAGGLDNRVFLRGYVFTINGFGVGTLQPVVSQSTTETTVEACKEYVWLKGLLLSFADIILQLSKI
jgi:hypothetical protein